MLSTFAGTIVLNYVRYEISCKPFSKPHKYVSEVASNKFRMSIPTVNAFETEFTD